MYGKTQKKNKVPKTRNKTEKAKDVCFENGKILTFAAVVVKEFYLFSTEFHFIYNIYTNMNQQHRYKCIACRMFM